MCCAVRELISKIRVWAGRAQSFQLGESGVPSAWQSVHSRHTEEVTDLPKVTHENLDTMKGQFIPVTFYSSQIVRHWSNLGDHSTNAGVPLYRPGN